MFNKDSLLKFLETKSVSFTLYQHARVFSKADLANMPKTAGEVLKSLVLTNKHHDLFMFTLPLNKNADLKVLALNIGSSRLSFGEHQDLKPLGVLPGMVSPLALLNDTEIRFNYFVPVELKQYAIVNCHPLDNAFSIDIALNDLEKLIRQSGHEVVYVADCLKA